MPSRRSRRRWSHRAGRVAAQPDIDGKTHAKTTTGKKGNKFGMDIERADELAAKTLRTPGLAMKGIHMHIGSPILTTEPYAEAVKKGSTSSAATEPLVTTSTG